jgi:hypothetical protein
MYPKRRIRPSDEVDERGWAAEDRSPLPRRATATLREQNPALCGGFCFKRLKGFEPSTFCMGKQNVRRRFHPNTPANRRFLTTYGL